MKKQILLLAFLVLAIFSSLTDSYGQAIKRSDPRPLACQNDALHPIAGNPYDYTLDATPSGGIFTWWATKNPDFVTSGGTPLVTTLNTGTALGISATELVAHSTNYGAGNGTAANTVNITWSSALLAGTQYQGTPGAPAPARTPTFVVAHYAAPAGSGCSDNLKVYELEPLNGFTVDILSLDPTTVAPSGTGQAVYDYDAAQCVDIVRGASYAPSGILYNYGTNVLYYEVVAANFSTQWTPHFQLGGLQGTQTADIVWSYDNTFATNVTVATGAGNGVHVSPSPAVVANTVTNTSLGVSIYVRVTIHNNTYETIGVNTINLAVAGQNNESLWDVDNNSATADCSAVTTETYEDAVDQLINPRPTVAEGTASVAPFTTNLNLIDPRP